MGIAIKNTQIRAVVSSFKPGRPMGKNELQKKYFDSF